MTFQWKKLGLIFNPAGQGHDKTWMCEFAQAPSALVFDKWVRVYFSCRPPADKEARYVSYSAYVDLDRKNLSQIVAVGSKPLLELGDLGAFDEFGTYPVSVIRNGDDVRAYYGGWSRLESVPFNVSIGLARSNDGGATFKKAGPGPVLSASPDEPFIIGGPKIRRYRDLWYLWYIAGKRWITDGRPEPVYKIRMATSKDGISWTRQNEDLIEDKLGIDEAQASPDVFFHHGQYHMFFCYRYGTDYRCKERGYRIGYAMSDNLEKWTRDDANAGIDVSESGWDSEMVSYPHVFELDGSVYMLYLGNQVGRYGFGLARLEGALD